MSGIDAFDRFEKELGTFLREQAPGEAPDRILADALHRSAAEPQRRGWRGRMHSGTPVGLALRGAAVVAVVVAAAAIGLQLTGVPPADSQSPTPLPSQSAEPSASVELPVACPDPPYTFVAVTGVAVEDRAACFGARELTLTGWVLRLTDPLPACAAPVPKSLAWLNCAQNLQPLAFGALPPGPYQPETRILWLATDPQGPVGPTFLGGESGQAILTNTWVEVAGHFDDPAADGCGSFASDPLRDACEGTFVVTSVTEIVAPWPMEALASSECITQPLDLLTLIFQTEPAACFGSADILVEAEADAAAGAVDGPCLNFEPAWFSCNSWLALNYVRPDVAASQSVVLAGLRNDRPGWFAANVPVGGFPVSLFAAAHPESGITHGEFSDQFMRVTGHFDDPAALTCRLSEDAPPAFEMTPEEVVSACRNMFVVTEVVPIE